LCDQKVNVEGISYKKLLEQANQRLAEQAKLIKAILNHSKTALATVDIEGRLIDANRYFKKKLLCFDKYKEDISLIDLIPDQERDKLKKQVINSLSNRGHCHLKQLNLLRQCNESKKKIVPAEVFFEFTS